MIKYLFGGKMKVIYDPETDSLTFILRKEKIQESDELKEGVIIDYDAKGRVVSIELLNASKKFLHPEKIEYEILNLKTA